MGGAGSGRDKEQRKKAIVSQALKNQTPETTAFLKEEAKQKGDRLFRVSKVYPSGLKATLGTIGRPNDAAIGARYGGGVYEVQEIDRRTEEPTGRMTKHTLHPASYPAKPEFEKDPEELELQSFELSERGSPMARVQGQQSAELIYERARRDAKEEFDREQRSRDLEHRVAELTRRLENGDTGGGKNGRSTLEEAASILDLVKKLSPTPMPLAPQLDPIAMINQHAEFLRTMKTLGTEFADPKTKASPMGEKVLATLTDLAGRGLTEWQRSNGSAPPNPARAGWANTAQPAVPPALPALPAAAPAEQRQAPPATAPAPAPAPAPQPAPASYPPPAARPTPSKRAGWANTQRTAEQAGLVPSAQGAAAGQRAQEPQTQPGTWPVDATGGHTYTQDDFPNPEAFMQFQQDGMTMELVELIKRDMNAQLSNQPGFSIFKTAEMIRARWSEQGAGAPWQELRNAVRSYPTTLLVNHFQGLAPELAPTPQHAQWLGNLIDVIKEREGVGAR